jgi:hypothetical protein
VDLKPLKSLFYLERVLILYSTKTPQSQGENPLFSAC